MKVDYIAVIDHERLYNDLLQLYQRPGGGGGLGSPAGIKVLKLTKSGGVVTRPPAFRRKTRMNKYDPSLSFFSFASCSFGSVYVSRRVREYFYGTSGDLCPHSTFVDFKVDLFFYVFAFSIPSYLFPSPFPPSLYLSSFFYLILTIQ